MAVYRNQVGTIKTEPETQFYNDVVRGLSSSPKFLSSKYFYDAEGDRLFQQIMHLPEYYLTKCELEIFLTQKKDICSLFVQKSEAFDIIELGAGDATKSTNLLRHLTKQGKRFTYYPVDISAHVIRQLEKEMPQRIPGLEVQGLNGDYFDMIHRSYEVSQRRKIVLFLGANIGNFSLEQAGHFLSALNGHLRSGDLLLTGFDLKKNPRQILAAYNDSQGVTRAFNLNLLKRMNREIETDFDLTQFDHYPTYDPVSGECRSFLISLADQEVQVGEHRFRFYRDEPVWTELSRKYTEEEITELALHSGYTPLANFYDSRHWFIDAAWEKG